MAEDKSYTDKMKGAMDGVLKRLRPRKKKPTRRNPEDVPLGKGMAEQGRRHIQGRRRRIDEAIEESGG